MRTRLGAYGAILVAILAVAFVVSRCSGSSAPSATAGRSKARFCATARGVAAANAAPSEAAITREQAQARLERQLASLRAVATKAEATGWAGERAPLSHEAVQHLAQALTRDCTLSIDIFGMSQTKTG